MEGGWIRTRPGAAAALAGVLGCGPGLEPDPSDELWASGFRIHGEPDALAGRAASILPDIDDDGIAELYVSERTIDDAFVVWGRRDHAVVHLDGNVGGAALRMPGILACDNAVDVDDDGRMDLDCRMDADIDEVIVLGSGKRESEIVAADAVAVERILPLPGLRTTSLVDPLAYTTTLHSWLGDVNADGRGDLWLEQRDHGPPDDNGVEAYDVTWETVLSTASGITSDSPRFDVDASSYARPLGDFDGDGIDDFVVLLRCKSLAGISDDEEAACVTVRVVFGGQNMTDPDWTRWHGFSIRSSPERDIGDILGTQCDVTGDGVPDLLVGVGDLDDPLWQDEEPSVALIAGGRRSNDLTALDVLSGEYGFELRGGSVEMIGDLDDDGRCEMRMAVWQDPRAAIVWGRERGEPVLWSDLERGLGGIMLSPPFEDSDLSWAARGAGDLTGDGVADVAFMFQAHDEPYENGGTVLVVSGAAIGERHPG